MMGFLFKFFVLPVLCLAAGFTAGWKVHDWRDASAEVTSVKRVVRVVQRQGTVNQAVAVDQQAVQDRIRTVTKTIIEKVPIYVTAKADAHCVVPTGFVRMHDAAALGLPPVPVGDGRSIDGPSGLELSTVADTVVANYGACNGFREQLIGWQAWYRGQQAAFVGKAP